ncbi:DNA-binding transcriptional regulator, MarR family [Treponema bryantii]|jgi:DNA-binding MarR family transcriptional regulator|uniref:DNA-binding transcriptional regulator, MarR family n=1 Tax=Treponema bryantii TaxID=163 RepID=A0A1I3KT59_9SPIR|nr:MarR family transcriptional regulator [Treponema bryantii]SFI75699.1 DNA-binding transcriptional regulator, MarR family [Treponema bryantii]
MDVNSSISLLSNIHSITADFLTEKLKAKGFPEFASSHGNILFQLSVNEKMTMGDLSEKINRDKSTTTVLVRKLEKEGFITGESDPSDKRSRIIFLTEKGKQFNATARELSQELLSTFYKDFSESEKQQFFESLQKIKKNFA